MARKLMYKELTERMIRELGAYDDRQALLHELGNNPHHEKWSLQALADEVNEERKRTGEELYEIGTGASYLCRSEMSCAPAFRPQVETQETPEAPPAETQDDDEFDPWAVPILRPATQVTQDAPQTTQVTPAPKAMPTTAGTTQVKEEIVEPKRPPPPCPLDDAPTQVETPAVEPQALQEQQTEPMEVTQAEAEATQEEAETSALTQETRFVDPLSEEGLEFTRFTNWLDFRSPSEPLATRMTTSGRLFLDVAPRDTGRELNGQQIKMYQVKIYQVGDQYFTLAPGNEDYFVVDPSAVREIGIPVLLEDTHETPGTSSGQPLMEVKPEPIDEPVDHQQLPSEEITVSAHIQGESETHEPLQEDEIRQIGIDTHAGGSDSSADLAGMD